MSKTEPQTDDGNEKRPFYTSIRVEPAGDSWKASEPESDKDLFGRGESPPEAVENYAKLLQDGDSSE